MSGGEWSITLKVPATDAAEVAKMCLACQDEPLQVKIDAQNVEVFGEQA